MAFVRFYYWEASPDRGVHQLGKDGGYISKEELQEDQKFNIERAQKEGYDCWIMISQIDRYLSTSFRPDPQIDGIAPTEGWTRPWGARKDHYFRQNWRGPFRSLCRNYSWFSWTMGSLEPDTHTSPDDCVSCRRKLDKENEG